MIENLLDMAARTAMRTFRLSVSYFYEDQKTGQRHPIACVERAAEHTEYDRTEGQTFVYTGKVFMLLRADWEVLDAWRTEMNIDVKKEPTPFGGDYILRVAGGETKRYQISTREPYSVIGPNQVLYRINTVFVGKDG